MDNAEKAVSSIADIINSSVANICTEVDTLLNSTCNQPCKPPDADFLKSFQMRLSQVLRTTSNLSSFDQTN